MTLTKQNIEDWDFREVEPFSETEIFWRENYFEVMAVEVVRLSFIQGAVNLGYLTVLEDGDLIVVSDPHGFYEKCFKRWSSHVSVDGLVTRRGRRGRRVGKSLWREWKKYGRIKLRLTPGIEAIRQASADRAAIRGERNVDAGDVT